MGRGVARHAWSDAREARRLSENACSRIQQRLQLVTERFAPSMAEERHRDHRRPQLGGLALCSNVERRKGLFAQPSLHSIPNDFLQGGTLRNHLYLEPKHRSEVKERNRLHHGLCAFGRMTT